jgi:hypothetical protein
MDLSGNPGGSLTAGADLFHIFFPDVVPYTATRLRAHPGAEFLSKAFSGLAQSPRKLQFELWEGNPFSWQAAVTPNQDGNFKSLEAWSGPYEIEGAPLSNLYANFNFTSISTTHSPITGYGPIPLDPSQRLFAPEDIVIVSCPAQEKANANRADHGWQLYLNMRLLCRSNAAARRSHGRVRWKTSVWTYAGHWRHSWRPESGLRRDLLLC